MKTNTVEQKILMVLEDGDTLSPSEIVKKSNGHIKIGSIYTTLAKMTTFVDANEILTSHGSKTYYGITKEGRASLSLLRLATKKILRS